MGDARRSNGREIAGEGSNGNRERLSGLLHAYRPGLRLVRARRLTGGIDASVHVLSLEAPDGARSRVVLRRYPAGKAWAPPERAAREFRTLQLVRQAGVPAPEPLYLDAEGVHFGVPALLLSYLPGRSILEPRHVAIWAEDLALAMHTIHAVTPDRYDMTWLMPLGPPELRAMLDEYRDVVGGLDSSPGRDAVQALDAHFEGVDWTAPCLVHEDFWPGNTVWYRGRLTGVIDWANARLGDRRLDVSQCRIDAMLVNGIEASDAILDAYSRLSTVPPRDQWFFDLLMGLRGLLNVEKWLVGYHDAGLTFMTAEKASADMEAFLVRALAAAG